MIPNPKTGAYKAHREYLAAAVRKMGIREVARRTGMPPIRISRFCGTGVSGGAEDAWTIYEIARALGYQLRLVPSSVQVS